MPEYLAPGVYVEETSFRSKSIEGVSTSTTAFVGPTRKGPVGVTPELLTSFGDFERIYGGLDDINGRPNYMAHAVRSYFENGGSRLYVSRVFTPATPGVDDGKAASDNLIDGGGQARFTARFPGLGGNGSISLHQVETPVTLSLMNSAPVGTMLRVGPNPPVAAQIQGGSAPFALSDGGQLFLTVGGAGKTVTFHGTPAEAIGANPVGDPLNIPPNTTLTVRIGTSGQDQSITLPAGNAVARADVVTAINNQLYGSHARLTDAGDAGTPNRLAIRTNLAGKAAWIRVTANTLLGFAADTTVSGSANAANNVQDIQHVTILEIDQLLQAANAGVHASDSRGTLVLTTADKGTAATLAVVGAQPTSVHTALGLQAAAQASGADPVPPAYYLKRKNDRTADDWQDSHNNSPTLAGLQPTQAPANNASVLTMTVVARDGDGKTLAYDGLGFDPAHPRYIGNVLTAQPTRQADALENLYAVNLSGTTALALRQGLFPVQPDRTVAVKGGNNGAATPSLQDYQDALAQLEKLDDVAIVAAPGHSVYDEAIYLGIQQALIGHAEKRRAYRIAVLDTPPGMGLGEVRTVRSRIDSTYAALYYPWVTVTNPVARPGDASVPQEINLPPSGFVCGIYARNDIQRGVFKAPANEVITGAIRFEANINFAQQEVLNPIGVNCLRSFPNRGNRVWGARTVSSDPEWKYVNVRRYFNYLEHSIDNGTQWAVFEPNGERLWTNVRDTIASFLYNEWINGALLGTTKDQAFFVRCDRSTMTQNDLDNGRLICLIGVAVLYPAEFVIFRIGQKTVDARS